MRIGDFFQGAVYCWCKNRIREPFSLRDLMGAENYYWEGTPLIRLYEKHEAAGKSEKACVKSAGQDAGRILKSVLAADSRRFAWEIAHQITQYRWLKQMSR